MMHVTIVVGNPKAGSRTRQVAEALAHKLLAPGSYDLEVIDLAEHTSEIFAWPSATMAELNARVAASDLVLVASPTYKATYTGLLKAFLDRYPSNGLRGVVAIPVMTGADLAHSMGPDVNLAPLLTELGASVPLRGLYFVTSNMDRLDELMGAAATGYRATFEVLGTFADELRQARTTGDQVPMGVTA
ncbi:NAD(P)H-dependent oxidoreductase [Nocardioides sp. cx-169]|uniref:NADPH-dependent FMN reductase n=1 Tax=Nocardioides sp. cx-169 TaxID=2899080 RepID=UPI001E5069C7|nr:NAD(P)H-dependent oxidoreductase [Nocardioides sp. cx-169]MCD4532898.1 NAD(P)H-dependent oxidoreductase [Nocardioides sp. cx-169]